MRTLESVCPEISRSEQYLSPPIHGREYVLAKKQSCSSETSNGTWIVLQKLSDFYLYDFVYDLVTDSKDEPEYNDGQSSDLTDISSKSNHVT